MQKLLKEPSTYAGFAAILSGVAQIFSVKEIHTVAGVIADSAPLIAGGNVQGILMTLLGAAAVFLREGKK